jgi:hypothetical protein
MARTTAASVPASAAAGPRMRAPAPVSLLARVQARRVKVSGSFSKVWVASVGR